MKPGEKGSKKKKKISKDDEYQNRYTLEASKLAIDSILDRYIDAHEKRRGGDKHACARLQRDFDFGDTEDFLDRDSSCSEDCDDDYKNLKFPGDPEVKMKKKKKKKKLGKIANYEYVKKKLKESAAKKKLKREEERREDMTGNEIAEVNKRRRNSSEHNKKGQFFEEVNSDCYMEKDIKLYRLQSRDRETERRRELHS